MNAIDELQALLEEAGARVYWVPPAVCLARKQAHLLGVLEARTQQVAKSAPCVMCEGTGKGDCARGLPCSAGEYCDAWDEPCGWCFGSCVMPVGFFDELIADVEAEMTEANAKATP